ncbi:relaxase/mobilization nuclease domain-containing protein, partial [Escherichia coli]
MIIGFSKYGTGSGKKAVNYCIDESRPGREHNPPEVLRGNPEYTTELIDSLDFKYKYTSGVLSFAPGETITPEMEEAIMDRFEDTAFAGLSRDQYCIMWVRHSHAGHHELHFITPRVELSTGKSLNIRPPGKETQKLFDALRSEINTRYGLADPDDPARARNVRIPDYELKIAAEKLRNGQEPEADIRKLLDNLFTQRAAHGTIKNRADLVEQVSELGFEVARQGKNYITVLEPESGKRWRLKGQLYEQEFNAERAIEAAGRIGTARNRGSAQRSAEEYRQRVEAYCAN